VSSVVDVAFDSRPRPHCKCAAALAIETDNRELSEVKECVQAMWSLRLHLPTETALPKEAAFAFTEN